MTKGKHIDSEKTSEYLVHKTLFLSFKTAALCCL